MLLVIYYMYDEAPLLDGQSIIIYVTALKQLNHSFGQGSRPNDFSSSERWTILL